MSLTIEHEPPSVKEADVPASVEAADPKVDEDTAVVATPVEHVKEDDATPVMESETNQLDPEEPIASEVNVEDDDATAVMDSEINQPELEEPVAFNAKVEDDDEFIVVSSEEAPMELAEEYSVEQVRSLSIKLTFSMWNLLQVRHPKLSLKMSLHLKSWSLNALQLSKMSMLLQRISKMCSRPVWKSFP
jgi:hypothetical protein